MSAETAGHVGTPQLKQFHMVYTKTKFPRGISDQAISLINPDGENESVRPGSGLKLRHGGLTPEASGAKPQAPSFKRQAHQATSHKRQAPSTKVQAPSQKIQAP